MSLGRLSVPRNESPHCEAVQTWHCRESRNHNLSPTEAPSLTHSLVEALVLYVLILEARWNIWNVICLSTNGSKIMVNHRLTGATCVPAEKGIRQMEIYYCSHPELRKVALSYNKWRQPEENVWHLWNAIPSSPGGTRKVKIFTLKVKVYRGISVCKGCIDYFEIY